MVNNLGNYLLKNLDNDTIDFKDIIIINTIDNRIIKIHKCVAKKSLFLNNLLINENLNNFTLPFSYDSILIIRKYLYIDELSINNDNYYMLFLITDFLIIEELLLYIVTWVINNNLHCYNALFIKKMIKKTNFKIKIYHKTLQNFIDSNIINILSLDTITDIDLYDLETICYKYTNLDEKYIYEAIKKWILKNNKKNNDLLNFIKKNLLNISLLPINYIWQDVFVFLNNLSINPIENIFCWKAIEFSTFYMIHKINNKLDYAKYLWCMNLEEDCLFDYLNCNYRWVTAKIISFDPINNSPIDCALKKKIKIKTEGMPINFTTTTIIELPKDLNKIEYLFTKTKNWRVELKKKSIVDILYNSLWIRGMIVFKYNEYIVIRSSNHYYIKRTIYADSICCIGICSNYNKDNIIDYQEIDKYINFDVLSKMQMSNDYSYQDIKNLLNL